VLPGDGPQPKFAGTAVPALIDGLIEHGASRVFMNAYLVGGASMFPSVLDVGARNAAAVRELLAGRRVPIVAEEVGGSKGRTIRVDVGSGAIGVREAGGRGMAVMM